MDTRCYVCDQIIQDVTESVTCSRGSSYHSVCVIGRGRSCERGGRSCTGDSSNPRDTTTDVKVRIRLYKFQNDLSSLECGDNVGEPSGIVQSLPSTNQETLDSIGRIGKRFPQAPAPSPARVWSSIYQRNRKTFPV